MLGQPVSMLIPRVVGFKLNGDLPEGATATDLVLTITEMLRKHGVVGKFVEFYGPGVSALPLANRATIGNMSPEFGSTIAVFPIDEETTKYLELTGRSAGAARAGRGLRQGAGPLARPATPSRASPRSSSSTWPPSSRRWPAPSARRTGSRCPTPRRRSAARCRLRRRGGRGEGVRRERRRVLPGLRRPVARGQRLGAAQGVRLGGPVRRRPPEQPGPGHARRRHGVRARPRRGRDRGDHVVHQHLEPVGDDRRRAAGQEGRREGPDQRKPWVKTTLAPGSKVVSDYYEKAGLTPYLDKLGFNLVGYGCTTCIGNSGPLIPEVSQAVNDNDLAVVSVLSGNRNFEGRINPDVKMNYLASPPLVVAYALAGSMDVDLFNDPLGQDTDGNDVFMKDIWPTRQGGRGRHRDRDHLGDVHHRLRRRLRRRRAVAVAADPRGQDLRLGRGVDLRPQAPVLRRHARRAGAGHRHRGRPGAAQARRLGHHRPHLPGRCDQEGLARRASTSPSTASSSGTSTPTARGAATTR